MASDLAKVTPDTRLGRADAAVSAEISGELVALDVSRGVCYGLNSIGTRIWQLIETPRSARQISELLVTEYDVSRQVCMEQTLNLLRDLQAAGLVVAAPEPASAEEANIRTNG